MKKSSLTDKEKMTLYGLVRYPNSTDKELSQKLGLKHSTVTSIRHRLKENNYFKTIRVPMLQNMGGQMLVVIYTNFSLLIPLEERIKITGKTIEVFDELFFSVGEQDKGFSLSLATDYSTIGKINDIRTQTFGSRGLLENQYPNMVIFPFDISRIYRFFDYSQLLKSCLELDVDDDFDFLKANLWKRGDVTLSNTEKKIFYSLVKYPASSDSEIGNIIGVSRHSVSKLRRHFEESNYITVKNLPNLRKLGFEILAFFHIKFDPSNPPDLDKDENASLMGDMTMMMASRRFETIILSAYNDYNDYKNDRTRIIQTLKEKKWIADHPMIRTYSLDKFVIIKEFKFVPITKKILQYEPED